MDTTLTSVVRKLLMLSACSIGVLALLAREFSHGLLPPRSLGIALLLLCIAIALWAMFIIRISAPKFRLSSQADSTSDEPAIMKRRLWAIRAAQILLAILILGLLNGLREIGRPPLLPRLVGVVVNLCIMAAVMRVLTTSKNSQT